MKTIAISIDESTVEAIDDLVATGDDPSLNRSKLIRTAVDEYIRRQVRLRREARDAEIVADHRELLALQAEALLEEQAEL